MNLQTTYLGLSLKNPLVASASPLSKTVDTMKRLEDAELSAVVMYSLFEEQVRSETEALGHYLDYGSESFAEALSYLPEPSHFHAGPDAYLEQIRQAKESLEIPVIASLNGTTEGGWVRYASLMEEAGADAIELNIYWIPADIDTTAEEVESRTAAIVRAVSDQVKIPVAAKIGPHYSAIGNVARRLVSSGARGLVLFNRFYQPDFDLEQLQVVPSLQLSDSYSMRLPLHWVALLWGRVECDFAVTSGVHTPEDVLKATMAGASATMCASSLLKYGLGHARSVLMGVSAWGEEHEYVSLEQMRGSMSQKHAEDPSAFERANYMRVLQSYRPDPAVIALG